MTENNAADATRDPKLERKLSLAEKPFSMVIAFKSRECLSTIYTLYSFDRAANRIRWGAGIHIPIERAQELLKKAGGFVEDLEEFVRKLYGGDIYDLVVAGNGYEDPAGKLLQARRRNSSIFIPKTHEGEKTCRALKGLDPVLMQIKLGCQDFTRSEALLKRVVELIIEFHYLTESLSEAAGTKYIPSKHIKTLINGMTKAKNGEA